MKLSVKHLLDINDLTRTDIDKIFWLTTHLKNKHMKNKQHNFLRYKSLALMFAKPSTRTRVSFEVGMTKLGGTALDLSGQKMQVFSKRESIKDTSKGMSRYVDGIVARLYSHQDLLDLAKSSSIPVINGLTDFNHPCQALADLYTIREKLGKDLTGRHLVFIGDGSDNVCNSLLQICYKLGVRMTIATPRYYPVNKEIMKRTKHFAKVTDNPKEAIKTADIIYTDTWVSMGQDAEARQKVSRLKPYQVNARLLSFAPKHTKVMHCLPAHRGQEITDDVMDGSRSIVFDQAENRLHVQKAILVLLMK
jgi:ornithine carbamoyltransferase